MTDLDAARRFVQEHARLIDRRRFDHLVDGASPGRVVAAVAAYANDDGGFAGVIEPDVRSTSSQPIGVLTAFEVLGEAGAPAPSAALDWLQAASGADGGLPFSLPSAADAPHAPWMSPSPGSSVHMTSAVLGAALRLGARHPWVDAASAFCRARLTDLDGLSAYETKYALQLFDAAGDGDRVEALAARIPGDGGLPVQGGVEGAVLNVLDLAPRPLRHGTRAFADAHVESALDALEAGQRPDGGWDPDWLAWSPPAALEWRGRRTVDAVASLIAYGRLDPARA